jgi:hypothetical protein
MDRSLKLLSEQIEMIHNVHTQGALNPEFIRVHASIIVQLCDALIATNPKPKAYSFGVGTTRP